MWQSVAFSLAGYQLSFRCHLPCFNLLLVKTVLFFFLMSEGFGFLPGTQKSKVSWPASAGQSGWATCCSLWPPCHLEVPRQWSAPFMADILSMVLIAIYKPGSLSQWHRNLRWLWRVEELRQGGSGGGQTACWICVSVLNGASQMNGRSHAMRFTWRRACISERLFNVVAGKLFEIV